MNQNQQISLDELRNLDTTPSKSNAVQISRPSSQQLTKWLVGSSAGDLASALALSKFCANLTPAQAMSPNNKQLSVLRKEDESFCLKLIGLLLSRTADLLNIKKDNSLSVIQMADLTYRIAKEYYFLRLEELLYIFQRATSGHYGKDYNRLDASTVMGWIERYDVTERTPLATSRSAQPVDQSTSSQPLDDKQLADFYQRVREGKKTITGETGRYSEGRSVLSAEEQDAYREARNRYVAEKQAGIVQDQPAPDDEQA